MYRTLCSGFVFQQEVPCPTSCILPDSPILMYLTLVYQIAQMFMRSRNLMCINAPRHEHVCIDLADVAR